MNVFSFFVYIWKMYMTMYNRFESSIIYWFDEFLMMIWVILMINSLRVDGVRTVRHDEQKWAWKMWTWKNDDVQTIHWIASVFYSFSAHVAILCSHTQEVNQMFTLIKRLAWYANSTPIRHETSSTCKKFNYIFNNLYVIVELANHILISWIDFF